LANSPSRPVHRAAVCIVFPGRPAASDASAAQDADHRRSVDRSPASCQALVRDYPLAMAEQAPRAAFQEHQGPQPPGAP